MKISKMAYEAFKNNNNTSDLEMWQGRYTGNTTGYILEFIGKCMQHPDRVLMVNHMPLVKQNHWVFDQIKDMVCDLELEHFEFRTTNLSVVYKPFVKVEKVTTWVVVND